MKERAARGLRGGLEKGLRKVALEPDGRMAGRYRQQVSHPGVVHVTE
ncbi:hypothetical protein [Faecalicatena contorta]